MMKKGRMVLTWIIAGLFLVVVGTYGAMMLWGSMQDDAPALVKGVMLGILLLILVPIMIMMVVTAVRRNREIEEEDEDDLSQY